MEGESLGKRTGVSDGIRKRGTIAYLGGDLAYRAPLRAKASDSVASRTRRHENKSFLLFSSWCKIKTR